MHTSNAEALPGDLIAWTAGRALTATGSPFDPVVYQDRTYQIAQANNALVFPGLGVAVVKGTRISDRIDRRRRRRCRPDVRRHHRAAETVRRSVIGGNSAAPAVAIAVATTAAED